MKKLILSALCLAMISSSAFTVFAIQENAGIKVAADYLVIDKESYGRSGKYWDQPSEAFLYYVCT